MATILFVLSLYFLGKAQTQEHQNWSPTYGKTDATFSSLSGAVIALNTVNKV